jgi:hypothetical protein
MTYDPMIDQEIARASRNNSTFAIHAAAHAAAQQGGYKHPENEERLAVEADKPEAAATPVEAEAPVTPADPRLQ